jgi:hypothetical protein
MADRGSRVVRVTIVAIAAIVACNFGGPSGGDTPDDASIPVPDAGMCESASAMCLPNGDVRTCLTAGGSAMDTACVWGCVETGGAHCGVLDPAGGGVTSDDVEGTGLSDFDLGGTVDSNNGAIGGTTQRGAGTGIIAGVDYKITASGVAVFRFKKLHVSGVVNIGGDHPTAFVASDTIEIDAVVDARGAQPCGYTANGKNGLTGPGPGGFNGALPKLTALGSGGGVGSTIDAGGGGGHGGNGGTGGNNAGGVAFGDQAITKLLGGGGGGGGIGGGDAGRGGGGGGALQLVSNKEIIINTNGGITAGGCGGDSGDGGGDTGGGGGAGGTILLEAPRIEIAGRLAVNGGGGGANGGELDARGIDATLDRVQATGGISATGNGGSGAAGAVSDGQPGLVGTKVGGGGGGIGWIRLNTRSGDIKRTGTPTLSPDTTDNPGAGAHCTAAKAKLK